MEWIILFIVALYYFDKSMEKKVLATATNQGGGYIAGEGERETPSTPSAPVPQNPIQINKDKIREESKKTGELKTEEENLQVLNPIAGAGRQNPQQSKTFFSGFTKKPAKKRS